MLRVGLTGGLGAGKSTVGQMFTELGAHVVSADEVARELMQPGEQVFDAIAAHFGGGVVLPDGQLDRGALARLAFHEGRVEELNSLVHPAVLARQAELAAALEREEPDAVLVVESALLFETRHGGPEGWRTRFNRIVLVVAEEQRKIDRYVARSAPSGDRRQLAAEARQRLANQMSDADKVPWADFVIRNNGSKEELAEQVRATWQGLLGESLRRTGR